MTRPATRTLKALAALTLALLCTGCASLSPEDETALVACWTDPATCGAGGTVKYGQTNVATHAAVRDSTRPCLACGAR